MKKEIFTRWILELVAYNSFHPLINKGIQTAKQGTVQYLNGSRKCTGTPMNMQLKKRQEKESSVLSERVLRVKNPWPHCPASLMYCTCTASDYGPSLPKHFPTQCHFALNSFRRSEMPSIRVPCHITGHDSESESVCSQSSWDEACYFGKGTMVLRCLSHALGTAAGFGNALGGRPLLVGTSLHSSQLLKMSKGDNGRFPQED